MKFVIQHEIRGRIRVRLAQKRMTYTQADTLQYFLEQQPFVTNAKVYERTAEVQVPEHVLEKSGRELNASYQEKLITKVMLHYGRKWFLPAPIRHAYVAFKALGYVGKGVRCLASGHLEVPVLDATAIGVSVLRQDFATAGSVMIVLGIG